MSVRGRVASKSARTLSAAARCVRRSANCGAAALNSDHNLADCSGVRAAGSTFKRSTKSAFGTGTVGGTTAATSVAIPIRKHPSVWFP